MNGSLLAVALGAVLRASSEGSNRELGNLLLAGGFLQLCSVNQRKGDE